MGFRRRRKKSTFDELFDMLFEMTGYFWQIGVIVTTMLLFISFETYEWVGNLNTVGKLRTNLTILIESYGWVLYSLPLIIFTMACIFGAKTYETYQGGRF